MPSVLDAAAAHIREQAAAYLDASKIPGYLAGVYHDGGQAVMAHGIANVVTGAPMREDTGFLFGSVTKLLTATLILQQAERGTIDLDDRVVSYLPEFKLATPSAAGQIRVRNLLAHTNGIDADLFFPDAKGRGALKIFVEGLGQHCGALFGPGEYISYSNGGMIVAGRLLEVVTGTCYHDLLKREVYALAGMEDSCTSAEEAILRSGFETALHSLTAELDTTPRKVNYQQRREWLRDWALPGEAWQILTSRLPPIPGHIQPELGDLKRQLASIYVWVRLTQGEHLFAPRPIEAIQFPELQNAWKLRRNTIWHHFQTTRPLRHYADLTRLLDEYGDQLAGQINSPAQPGPARQPEHQVTRLRHL